MVVINPDERDLPPSSLDVCRLEGAQVLEGEATMIPQRNYWMTHSEGR